MKKATKVLLAVMFAVIMLGGVASPSHAIFKAETGFLVPYAYYTDTTDTVVGILSPSLGGDVYWNFISPDGVNWAHGVSPCSGINKMPFSLKTQDGGTHQGLVGYLIFTWDGDDGILDPGEVFFTIAGNAILLSANDAAFLPAIPLSRDDYANVALDLSDLDGGSIIGLSYGMSDSKDIFVNYWIDPAFSAQTQVVMWSTGSLPATIQAKILPAIGSAVGKNVTFNRDHTVLNAYNVATETNGLDPADTDGFVHIVKDQGGDRIVFSLIKSSAFSAMQTMLGFYY